MDAKFILSKKKTVITMIDSRMALRDLFSSNHLVIKYCLVEIESDRDIRSSELRPASFKYCREFRRRVGNSQKGC